MTPSHVRHTFHGMPANNILGLPNVEYTVLRLFFPWLFRKMNVGSNTMYGKFMGLLACAVAPSSYFTHASDIATTMRLLLSRLYVVHRHIQKLRSNLRFIVEPKEDLFTYELTDQPILALTDGPQQTEGYATLDSWAYHFVMNGPLHPLSRKPIEKLVLCALHEDSLNRIAQPDAFSLAERFWPLVMDSIKSKPIETIGAPITVDLLLEFESFFDIPDDRCYSNILIQMEEDDGLSMYEASEDGSFLEMELA
jgi:hypothetical protein